MRFREDATRGRRLFAAALTAIAGSALLAGCGEDDFPNEPRPATAVEVSAAITKRGVSVSPERIGAGLVELTISNQLPDPVTVTLSGAAFPPTEVPAGGTGRARGELAQGSYEVAAAESGVSPATLEVAGERPSSSDELLLP